MHHLGYVLFLSQLGLDRPPPKAVQDTLDCLQAALMEANGMRVGLNVSLCWENPRWQLKALITRADSVQTMRKSSRRRN